MQQMLQQLVTAVDELKGRLSVSHKHHYTVEEVAEATGRAPYTVRTWIRDGRLNAIRVAGTGPRGRLLIPREEFVRLIADGKGGDLPDIAVSD